MQRDFEEDVEETGGGIPILNVHESYEKIVNLIRKALNQDDVSYPMMWTLLTGHKGDEPPLQTFKLEEGDSVQSVAEDILATAKQDIEGIGRGHRRFLLKNDGGKDFRISFTLRIPSQDEDPESVAMEINPTHKGVVAQVMGQNQDLHRVVMRQSTTTLRAMERRLNELEDRNRYLERRHIEQINAYEAFVQRTHERELDLKREAANEERKKQVGDLLMMGMPTVLNALAGKRLLTESQTPMEGMLFGFLSSLDPPQLEKLVTSGILRPEQSMAIMEMLKAVAQREEAAEAAKQGAKPEPWPEETQQPFEPPPPPPPAPDPTQPVTVKNVTPNPPKSGSPNGAKKGKEHAP